VCATWQSASNIFTLFRFRSVRQSGIFRRIYSTTFINPPPEEETAFPSVDQNAVLPLLAVLFTGTVISLIVLLTERDGSHFLQHRNRKRTLHRLPLPAPGQQ